MTTSTLEATIESGWEIRDRIDASTQGPLREAVTEVLARLDAGELRVAEKRAGAWKVNEWAKKAVLLSFRLSPMSTISGAAGGPNGGTRLNPSSLGGRRSVSRKPVSARYRVVSSVIRPTCRPPPS